MMVDEEYTHWEINLWFEGPAELREELMDEIEEMIAKKCGWTPEQEEHECKFDWALSSRPWKDDEDE